jgi:hypothetical protein
MSQSSKYIIKSKIVITKNLASATIFANLKNKNINIKEAIL